MLANKSAQINIAAIGITFPNGILKGRGKSGYCRRNKITIKEIKKNTDNEPTLAINARFRKSKKPASNAAKHPLIHNAKLGLCVFGFSFAQFWGKNPPRLIAFMTLEFA